MIESLTLQLIEAGIGRPRPDVALTVFRQRTNGFSEQALVRAKRPSAIRVKPNHSGAPSRPQAPPPILQQRQDRLAQGSRSRGRFEPLAHPAKQAANRPGPKVS